MIVCCPHIPTRHIGSEAQVAERKLRKNTLKVLSLESPKTRMRIAASPAAADTDLTRARPPRHSLPQESESIYILGEGAGQGVPQPGSCWPASAPRQPAPLLCSAAR